MTIHDLKERHKLSDIQLDQEIGNGDFPSVG